MIFHKKIFQWVTAPIPLFQTPQKIGLLMYLSKQIVFNFNFPYKPSLDMHMVV